MYLIIQNAGVAPVEAFTVLGVSTARNNTDKIGMFGTGGKHSINILLRAGLNPRIFLGQNELSFYSKPDFMGDKQYNRVFYNYKGQVEKTGFSLEFGEMDWDSVEMVLREFISNAIDVVGVDNVVLDITDKPIAYDGATSIYVPLTPDVQKYYNNLSEKFLHFTRKNEEKILEKNSEDQALIYRKGVFVRQISKMRPKSLFNYNFDDSVKIDESRNMQDYTCVSAAAKILGNDQKSMEKYFKTLQNDEKIWEDDFPYYEFNKHIAAKAWKNVYGDTLIANNDLVCRLVESKGLKAITIRNYATVVLMGIACAEDKVNKVEKEGSKIVPATRTAEKNLNKVWRKLEGIGLTNGKNRPQIRCFNRVCQGETLYGYYENGTIYINIDHDGSFQTILEECAHYITGAEDGSRVFQEFAFNVACRLVPAWNK